MAGYTPAFSRGFITTAILLALGVMGSIGRETVLAALFGTNAEVEIFRLAFALPNLLATSLAPLFVAALLPTMSEMARRGHEATGLRPAILVALLLSAGIGLSGVFTTDLQARIIAPGLDPESRGALADLMMLIWAFFFLVAITFGPRAYLSTIGTTWPMASSNLVLSGTMALILLGLQVMGYTAFTARTIAFAALAAAITLLIVHAFALPASAMHALRSLAIRPNLRRELVLPALAIVSASVGHVVGSLPRFVDRALATHLPQGTVASLEYSFAIITVPGVLIGTAFNIAVLPLLTSNLKSRNPGQSRRLFQLASLTTLAAFCVGPLVSFWAEDVVRLAFQRGSFSVSDTLDTTTFLYWHGFAIGPLVSSLIFSQILIANGFVRVFLAISALRLLIKLLTASPLTEHFGLEGLAASFIAPELASFLAGLAALVILHRKGRLFCQS